MDFALEICSDSILSALTAQEAGAARVELCDNLYEGGTTPGYGTILAARERLRIGLNVLIRPRGGDFLYDDTEFGIMCRDIELCRQAGADGVVAGILKPDGSIDTGRTGKLVSLAEPMSFTFHRAFDMCPDPLTALEDIIGCGADRILTSGQRNTAAEGVMLLRSLVEKAGTRIVIMPGSGINESNILYIARETRAHEFHLSARKEIASGMQFRQKGITMGGVAGYDEFLRKVADGERIRRIAAALSLL